MLDNDIWIETDTKGRAHSRGVGEECGVNGSSYVMIRVWPYSAFVIESKGSSPIVRVEQTIFSIDYRLYTIIKQQSSYTHHVLQNITTKRSTLPSCAFHPCDCRQAVRFFRPHHPQSRRKRYAMDDRISCHLRWTRELSISRDCAEADEYRAPLS